VIHVSCAAEGAYVRHSAAMLHSVLAHRGGRAVTVHYLHGPRFPAAAGRRLAAMAAAMGGTVAFHRIEDHEVAGLPAEHRFTPAMWYRLLLPERLPSVDRVLYLDVDTLAADDLGPLWETDLRGNWVAAVTNVFEPWAAGRPAELGLPGPQAYFNSGVLLLDLAGLRRDGRGTALRAFVREHGDELLWPDQDALNVVLGERRLPLHPRWNAMNSVLAFPWSADVFGARAVEEARRRPGIRHFEGPGENKPWHLLCSAPGREAYFAHRRGTPWPRVRREGVTPANVARRAWRRLRA
jgi:lipopolysaccharide biosynthesis glycosyltransferase